MVYRNVVVVFLLLFDVLVCLLHQRILGGCCGCHCILMFLAFFFYQPYLCRHCVKVLCGWVRLVRFFCDFGGDEHVPIVTSSRQEDQKAVETVDFVG